MKKTFKKIIVIIITWQAKIVLSKYKPKIIAITGSVGKTSTKDAIFVVLSKFKNVRKSEKSFNSEIGLPLTILGLPNGWDDPFIWFENIMHGFYLMLRKQPYPEYLVLEIGVGKPGDIKNNVIPWLKPDVVIVTRFPDKPVHVEFFGSVEKIIEEKSSLVSALKKDGILILNHDDEKVYALHQKSKYRTVSYGMHNNATYHSIYPTYLYSSRGNIKIPSGINFKLEYEGNTFPVMLPNILGVHNIGQAAAAIACARELGCDLLESINAVSEYVTPPGRLSLVEGINNSVIIDDTYNSSPVAMSAAILVLKEIEGKRKIAVIGDMLELGKFTEDEHYLVGENIYGVADILIVVGPRAKTVAEGALEKGFKIKNVYSFDSSKTAAKFLEGIVEEGDIILVKGSQGVRLERAVEAIMEDKKHKRTLLCRQDKEWLNR
ncbi:MAG: UDP-N-acetylmuramoyl-tripeptide--D-alanyl-D-alanine ligase [Candidatus Nomurabacteria bacterium]|nr:UDP-N-acetylmuramoyl-tripeptide--D-alanyl-D-alanine ligase [Candidatus Nomurabacteria bacterium]